MTNIVHIDDAQARIAETINDASYVTGTELFMDGGFAQV
jgi:hypothetical protein